jgi:pimeloyl-ACP methyl ester carboxylesterase
MGRLRFAIEVDVTDAISIPGHHVMRGVVVAPSASPEPLVWCCLPGGNCTSAYFDLHVDGDDTSYSMAAHLADAGYVVLALDHLSTGSSTRVADDFVLTPEVLASASHAAFTTLLQQLRGGTLSPELPSMEVAVPVGVGHSMGAMITFIAQARHGTYRAVVNLGGGGAGLVENLRDPQWASWSPEVLRAELVTLARQQFDDTPPDRDRSRPGPFHADDVPQPVRHAFRAQLTNLLPASALASIIPFFSDRERGELDLPLFLGFGEHDLAQNPHDGVRTYRSASDITLVVLAGSGHCHNQAGNRHQLWDRMIRWARSVPISVG